MNGLKEMEKKTKKGAGNIIYKKKGKKERAEEVEQRTKAEIIERSR